MKNKTFLFKLSLVFFILLILFPPLFAFEQPKSKPFAFFLSVVSPGMGQIYLGNPEKGIAILSASSLLGMGILSTVGRIQFGTVNGMVPGHIGFQIRNDLDSSHLFWAGSLSITYIILYFYNLSDVAKFSLVRPVIKADSTTVSAGLDIDF